MTIGGKAVGKCDSSTTPPAKRIHVYIRRGTDPKQDTLLKSPALNYHSPLITHLPLTTRSPISYAFGIGCSCCLFPPTLIPTSTSTFYFLPLPISRSSIPLDPELYVLSFTFYFIVLCFNCNSFELHSVGIRYSLPPVVHNSFPQYSPHAHLQTRRLNLASI